MLEQINLTYEKVVLVGIINQLQTEEKSKEYLDELEFLTYTAGGEVLKRFMCLTLKHSSAPVKWKKYSNLLKKMR